MHAEHEYRSIFSNLTSTKLSKADLKSALSSLGMNLDDKLFEEKFTAADVDESNTITDKFVKFC